MIFVKASNKFKIEFIYLLNSNQLLNGTLCMCELLSISISQWYSLGNCQRAATVIKCITVR